MQSIEESVEAILEFLQEISMSDRTVNNYRRYYHEINKYCQNNGINKFSVSDANAFSKIQMARYENGEIGLGYVRMRRKAAAMLADRMCGKNLVWERRLYHQKHLCECYEQATIAFEAFLSQTLAPISVRDAVRLVGYNG
jgi:site-specific recombinase XerC